MILTYDFDLLFGPMILTYDSRPMITPMIFFEKIGKKRLCGSASQHGRASAQRERKHPKERVLKPFVGTLLGAGCERESSAGVCSITAATAAGAARAYKKNGAVMSSNNHNNTDANCYLCMLLQVLQG